MNQEEFDKLSDSYNEIQNRYIYGLTPSQKKEAIKLQYNKETNHILSPYFIRGIPENAPWFNIITLGHSGAFRYFVFCPLQMVFTATEVGFTIDWVGCEKPIDVKYENLPKIIEKLFKS